jgi:hypothetical protein
LFGFFTDPPSHWRSHSPNVKEPCLNLGQNMPEFRSKYARQNMFTKRRIRKLAHAHNLQLKFFCDGWEFPHMRTSPSRNFFANTDQLWAHKQIFHNNTTDTGRTGPFVNFPPPPPPTSRDDRASPLPPLYHLATSRDDRTYRAFSRFRNYWRRDTPTPRGQRDEPGRPRRLEKYLRKAGTVHRRAGTTDDETRTKRRAGTTGTFRKILWEKPGQYTDEPGRPVVPGL